MLREPNPVTLPGPDPEAYALEASLRSLVWLGAATSPRSRQRVVGASELGEPCQRKLAYRLDGTPPVNLPDPLRATVGTGVHAVMADMFRRLDAESGRFLVEIPVRYRGIPGTVDLFDRLTATVIDWKTVLRGKLGKLRVDGPPERYRVQLHTYAAGLMAMGETVRWVALAYMPIDSTLDDMWVWRTAASVAEADTAIDRLNGIHERKLNNVSGVIEPAGVEAKPSVLCGWCDYHRPGIPTDDYGCKGDSHVS